MKGTVQKARRNILSFKKLTQKVNRKELIEKELRQERKKFKRQLKRLQEANNATSEDNSSSLKKELKKLKKQMKSKDKKLVNFASKVSSLNTEVSSLKKENSELKTANDYLISLIEDRACESVDEGTRNEFPTRMRKVIYKSLLSQVPVAHTGELISYTMQELGSSCGCCSSQKVPHKSTVARMAYELSALTAVQAAATPVTTECMTLLGCNNS